MMRSIAVFAACLLLSGGVVAGCGGGDSSTAGDSAVAANAGADGREGEAPDGKGSQGAGGSHGDGESSDSKAKFVAEAKAVCAEQQQQLQAKLRQLFKSDQASQGKTSQQAMLRQIAEDAIAPAMQAEADELRALEAPPGDEDQVEEVIAALDVIVAEAREDPTGLATNPNTFQKVRKLAGNYGIGTCGSLG